MTTPYLNWKVFPSPPYPWGEWFYSNRIWGWEWPSGYYWCYKIAPSGGHSEQLAVRSESDRTTKKFKIYKDRKYIITDPGDTPNWGATETVQVATPCGNWLAWAYSAPAEATRSQTSRFIAAVQANRQTAFNVDAAVAKTDYLTLDVEAVVQGNPHLDLDIKAAIQGDTDLPVRMRSAVRAEVELAPEVEAAVATEFWVTSEVEAAVQGNPRVTVDMKAAVLGETGTEYNVVAMVLKRRTEAIILEMENLWPQQFANQSVPNWPSNVRHWGRDPL